MLSFVSPYYALQKGKVALSTLKGDLILGVYTEKDADTGTLLTEVIVI